MPLKRRNKQEADEIRPHKLPEAPQHGNSQHGGDEVWLVSYADMMTLLCGFFIMMFSLSSLDQPKFEAVKQEIAKEFGGKYEKPASQELAEFVTQVIQEAGVEKQTVVKFDASGVSVAFQSTVFFETLAADVKPEGRVVLDKLIAAISSRQTARKSEYKIVVEGHTDSRPILAGTFPSNWELSGARAARVVRLFLNLGFAPDKLTAIGYADTRPELPSRTPAGTWDENALSKNRRVVLRILDPEVRSIPLAETVASAAEAAASRTPAQTPPAVIPPEEVVSPTASASPISVASPIPATPAH